MISRKKVDILFKFLLPEFVDCMNYAARIEFTFFILLNLLSLSLSLLSLVEWQDKQKNKIFAKWYKVFW